MKYQKVCYPSIRQVHEKSIEILAPAVANREEVMRTVVDKARDRIAARKKQRGQKISTGNSEGMDEN